MTLAGEGEFEAGPDGVVVLDQKEVWHGLILAHSADRITCCVTAAGIGNRNAPLGVQAGAGELWTKVPAAVTAL
ncbi:hypothetical protein GCM10010430_42900 [Kitasatospora cystarginea]|uniref:Uncharacterized protein n=1 Tax=Kitasatospora cystarginea TaxID=58350 RepID=A0ABN3ECN9_9ACTN